MANHPGQEERKRSKSKPYPMSAQRRASLRFACNCQTAVLDEVEMKGSCLLLLDLIEAIAAEAGDGHATNCASGVPYASERGLECNCSLGRIRKLLGRGIS